MFLQSTARTAETATELLAIFLLLLMATLTVNAQLSEDVILSRGARLQRILIVMKSLAYAKIQDTAYS